MNFRTYAELHCYLINRSYRNHQQFFATFLTASDHGPYIVPNNIPFHPHSLPIEQQIVEYADWSIGNFLRLASQQQWFENTIFVFVADHGIGNENTYDIPLSFHHIPCIIFDMENDQPKEIISLAGQVDVYPTIMGLLKVSYVNNSFGVDVLKENRDYIYFNNDDKLGCLSDSLFFIYRTNGGESLHKYHLYEITDCKNNFQREFDVMKIYSFSMIQATQWMIEQKKVHSFPIQ